MAFSGMQRFFMAHLLSVEKSPSTKNSSFYAFLLAVLSPTQKWRTAARHDGPGEIIAMIRWRKSIELALPMTASFQ